MQVRCPGLCAGADGQGGEADIFPGHAHPVVLDWKRQSGSERGAQGLHDPIAEQIGPRVVAGPHQAGRQDEGRGQVRGPIARPDPVHGAMQRVAVPRHGGHDPRGGTDGNDGHSIRWPELIDDRVNLAPGFRQARGRQVGRLHGSRGVDQHEAVAGEGGAGRQRRLQRGGDEDGGGQQLQKQQPAGAQPLPGDIGLTVSDLVGPEVQGRHDASRPPNFQKVQRHDRRDGQRQDRGRRSKKRHPSSPIRRSVRCTISSIGSALERRAKRRPRRCAARSISVVRWASAFT